MFDLDMAVASWRKGLRRRSSLSPRELDELEDHLRAHFELELELNATLAPPRAFAIVRADLGEPAVLSREFAKARRPQWKRLLVAAWALFAVSFGIAGCFRTHLRSFGRLGRVRSGLGRVPVGAFRHGGFPGPPQRLHERAHPRRRPVDGSQTIAAPALGSPHDGRRRGAQPGLLADLGSDRRRHDATGRILRLGGFLHLCGYGPVPAGARMGVGTGEQGFGLGWGGGMVELLKGTNRGGARCSGRTAVCDVRF